MSRVLNPFTNLFPIWVVADGLLALFQPGLFSWFRGHAIVWGLAVIMLGMGICGASEMERAGDAAGCLLAALWRNRTAHDQS